MSIVVHSRQKIEVKAFMTQALGSRLYLLNFIQLTHRMYVYILKLKPDRDRQADMLTVD